MAYDERLADRIRDVLGPNRRIAERKMFGGVAFLRDGHMFVGVTDESLMVRVGKELHADSLRRAHVRPMDFTGKPMNGYVFVDPAGIRSAAQLRFWVERATAFVSGLPPKSRKR